MLLKEKFFNQNIRNIANCSQTTEYKKNNF